MMTPYEIIDVGQSNIGTAIECGSIFIAVASGYFVAAYMVGSKLTFTQVFILNLNYIVWAIFLGLSGSMAMANAFRQFRQAAELTGIAPALPPYGPQVYFGMAIMVISTSLWFMWSIRHPKTH